MDAKRAFDLAASAGGITVLAPVIAGLAGAIWLHDKGSPIYAAKRCGRDGGSFTMYKFRTMVMNADELGGSSTGNEDPRITSIGRTMRATKADELPQLVNVLTGDMSIVGPRPNIDWEVDTFSEEERPILSIRPGITDLASIVFADEGAILSDAKDPDLAYEQLIRPWKSRLGLLYARNAGVPLDLRIIALTLLNTVNRAAALARVARLVESLGASPDVVAVTRRSLPLTPAAPPGFAAPITHLSA